MPQSFTKRALRSQREALFYFINTTFLPKRNMHDLAVGANSQWWTPGANAT